MKNLLNLIRKQGEKPINYCFIGIFFKKTKRPPKSSLENREKNLILN